MIQRILIPHWSHYMCCVAELTGAHMDDQRTIVAGELFQFWPGLGLTVTPPRGFDARNALRSGEHFGFCHTRVTLISYMQMLQGQIVYTGHYIMWVRLPLISALSRAEIKFGLNWLFSSATASSKKAGLGWITTTNMMHTVVGFVLMLMQTADFLPLLLLLGV